MGSMIDLSICGTLNKGSLSIHFLVNIRSTSSQKSIHLIRCSRDPTGSIPYMLTIYLNSASVKNKFKLESTLLNC